MTGSPLSLNPVPPSQPPPQVEVTALIVWFVAFLVLGFVTIFSFLNRFVWELFMPTGLLPLLWLLWFGTTIILLGKLLLEKGFMRAFKKFVFYLAHARDFDQRP